jgi:hypothetical protein
MGLLILAATTVYGFFVNTLALWMGARLLALEKKGLKTALLTAFVYTVIYAAMFSAAYLVGLFSDLLSIILIYSSILISTILLILLIKVFYKIGWKNALTAWLLVLGANTVIHVLLALVLAILTTTLRIVF